MARGPEAGGGMGERPQGLCACCGYPFGFARRLQGRTMVFPKRPNAKARAHRQLMMDRWIHAVLVVHLWGEGLGLGFGAARFLGGPSRGHRPRGQRGP